MKRSLFIFSLLFLMVNMIVRSQTTSNYSIANKFKIAGDGGWDYLSLDSKSNLYVSHGTVVQIVNTKTGTVLGTIENLKRVHGIAVAETLNKGFISNAGDSTVVVFDLTSYKTLEKIKVTGANPDAILFDPHSSKVFVFNGRTSNATVIDANTDKVVATITLEGKPEFSVTDKKGKIYVNIEDKSKITCISSDSLKVIKSWSISPGKEPSGLAADFTSGKLFSVCDNQNMIVFDITKEKVTDSLKIGESTDGAAFDEGLKRVYSSNGDGTLTVVQENGDKFTVLENVTTKEGARTICVDQATHHLYLPTADLEKPKDDKSRPKVIPGTFEIIDVAPKSK